VSAFETEFFISGLAPLADQLVTLYYVKESSEDMVILPTLTSATWKSLLLDVASKLFQDIL